MTRPLFIAAGFAALSAYAAGLFYNSFWLALALSALCAITYVFFGAKKNHFLFLCTLGIAIGFWANCLYQEGIYRPLYAFDDKSVEICAKIEGVTQTKASYGELYIYSAKLISVEDHEKRFTRPVNFTVYANEDLGLTYADLVRFSAAFSMDMPDQKNLLEDETLYEWGNGTAFSVFAYPSLVQVTGHAKENPLMLVSGWVKDRIRKASFLLPEKYRPLISGLLTGDKSGMEKELKDSFSQSGMLHILAASGMHLSVLTAILAFMLGAASLGTGVSGLMLSVFVLFYMAVAGFSPSIVRAGLMYWFSYLAFAVKRDYDGFSALGASALLLLALNPYCVFSLSFLLSFAATAGILYIPTIKSKYYTDSKIKKPFININRILLFSFAANLFTAPFLLLYFNRVSLLTPLANLLILPMLPFLFGFCILFLFLFPVPFLGGLLAQIVRLLFDWILLVVDFICNIPFSSVNIYNPYKIAFAIFAVLLAGVFLGFSKKENYKKDLALIGMIVVISFCAVTILPKINHIDEGAKIIIVDVGDGAAAIIETADKTALIDCGTSDSNIKPYKKVLAQLSQDGIGSLDYLILTHYHSDHVNGVDELLRSIKVSHIVLRPFGDEDKEKYDIIEVIQQSKADIIEVSEQMEIPLSSDSHLTVFAPFSGLNTTDENENGIALQLESEGYSALFTGDYNKNHELMLMRDGHIAADLLMVSHHGSKSSSSEAFIRFLSPDVSVISCGKNNGYGHPNQETLDILKDSGSEVLRTDQDGTIVIYFKPKGMYYKK